MLGQPSLINCLRPMNKQFLGVKRQNQQASFEVSLMLSFKNGTFF